MAVRDGILIRSLKQQAATLQINTRNEHIRFRYMHMNPSAMDADGILNGRRVAEGEKIGVVSNYLDFPNGTSYHLHFDIQVFTRDGWIWVNPYTTLIASYERLIRSRGREIGTDPPIAAAVAHALPGGRLPQQYAGRPRELAIFMSSRFSAFWRGSRILAPCQLWSAEGRPRLQSAWAF